jgi:hypothetical protein
MAGLNLFRLTGFEFAGHFVVCGLCIQLRKLCPGRLRLFRREDGQGAFRLKQSGRKVVGCGPELNRLISQMATLEPLPASTPPHPDLIQNHRALRHPPVLFGYAAALEIGLDRDVGREFVRLLPFADGAEKGFGLLGGGSKDRRFAFGIHEQQVPILPPLIPDQDSLSVMHPI